MLAREDVAADLLKREVERIVVKLVLAADEVVDELALIRRHAVLDALDLENARLFVQITDLRLALPPEVHRLECRARER